FSNVKLCSNVAARFSSTVEGSWHRRIRFYDLRHTSATLALSIGYNVKVVSERLGHSSANTLYVYAKAITTLQRESAAKMGSLLSSWGLNKGLNNGQKKAESSIS
ncbi:MAG: tyrosine-type recombinase/integrase, partial [Candidatus Eremiobacteraeota bacterium]|nr:tyrosine-type recombinase/integrase [Candidatus Eremiobacteraeota bacterium]